MMMDCCSIFGCLPLGGLISEASLGLRNLPYYGCTARQTHVDQTFSFLLEQITNAYVNALGLYRKEQAKPFSTLNVLTLIKNQPISKSKIQRN